MDDPIKAKFNIASSKIEHQFVKKTYDNIAIKFDATRYKKWPKVEQYINAFPKYSLILDAGCGNGKYLDSCDILTIGCDISYNLLSICRAKGHEVVQCDLNNLPFRDNVFDGTICIAALHHLSTKQRRQECLNNLTHRLVCQNSKSLIYVWAYEQSLEPNNPYLKNIEPEDSATSNSREKFDLPNLNDNDETLEVTMHTNRTPFAAQDVLVPFKIDAKNQDAPHETHLRYYHVFKKGELEEIINQCKGCKIVQSYYDKGNWCCIVERSDRLA